MINTSQFFAQKKNRESINSIVEFYFNSLICYHRCKGFPLIQPGTAYMRQQNFSHSLPPHIFIAQSIKIDWRDTKLQQYLISFNNVFGITDVYVKGVIFTQQSILGCRTYIYGSFGLLVIDVTGQFVCENTSI